MRHTNVGAGERLTLLCGSVRLTVDVLVGLVDSSFERYRECVEGGLPSHGPACSASACRVEGSGGDVEAFQRGRVVREVPSRADGTSVAGVERLDRVCAADHAPNLDVVVQERYELAPGVLPELC
jgi:hypothetical protein